MIIAPVGSLGAGLGGLESLAKATPTGAGEGLAATAEGTATGGTQAPNFGAALTEAVSSLDSSQASADSASQALATGSVSNPEQAVATVEDASMEMQLAAEIRSKASEAVQTIFATQV